jgi:hypothetical protein
MPKTRDSSDLRIERFVPDQRVGQLHSQLRSQLHSPFP